MALPIPTILKRALLSNGPENEGYTARASGETCLVVGICHAGRRVVGQDYRSMGCRKNLKKP